METYTFLFPTVPSFEVRFASSTKVVVPQISEVKRLLLMKHWPTNLSISSSQVASLRFLSMGRELNDQDSLQVLRRAPGDEKSSPIHVHIVRATEPKPIRPESQNETLEQGNCCCSCVLF